MFSITEFHPLTEETVIDPEYFLILFYNLNASSFVSLAHF